MRNSVNFVDLFDWEVESERHYIKLLTNEKEEDFEYKYSSNKLPAKIEVTNEKTIKNENKSRKVSRNKQEKL
jgi:hypothetical protein